MVVLGRVSAPYGVLGWVRVQPYADDPISWRQMSAWWLGDHGDWREFRLEGCRMHGSDLLAKLAGIDDRESALERSGFLVGAPREALPPTKEGEFYWADLLGLRVVNRDGAVLGEVAGLIETGAHDVLRVVNATERETLIPLVEAYVSDIDPDAGLVRVDWEPDW